MFSIITTHNPTEFDAYFESTNFEIKVIADSDTGVNLFFEIEVRGHYFSLTQTYMARNKNENVCSVKWMNEGEGGTRVIYGTRVMLYDKTPDRQKAVDIATEFCKELTEITGETPLQSFVSYGKEFNFEEARSIFGRAMNNVVGEQKYNYLFA